MNKARSEHLKRMNPTGVKWEDMTEEQREELQAAWDEVVSKPKNIACTCPRTPCENNHNCQFCMATHRYYGSLPDCLRRVDDEISKGVPPEKRHNIHTRMNPTQKVATNREDYAIEASESVKADPNGAENAKKRMAEWHKLVREPENVKCRCPRTDCKYNGNCVKCIALHRSYGGMPYCCEEIYDKIDAAAQAYWAEQGNCGE